MRYKYDSLGLIDKERFARSYVQKIIRDHIDGKRPSFLADCFSLEVYPSQFDRPNVQELYITDGLSGITLGEYYPRSILQRHRYRLWHSPDEFEWFFALEFDDYLKLYEITDQETTVLAKLRWS